MISDRTRTIIIFVVTTVWAINFGAGLVVPSYHPSESINGIFMGIVGGLFALGARNNSNGSSNNRLNRPSNDATNNTPEQTNEASNE